MAVNPAGRYEAILLWYKAGVHAVEWAFQYHTDSWLMANNCYRDSLPMLLEEAVQWKAVAGAGAVGRARGQ